MADDLKAEIRRIIADHARLAVDVATLSDQDDLFFAGMTSQANVNVMLALEASFDIEFPEESLKRSTFESVDALAGVIAALLAEGATV